jgi:F-type H+-transporting ATPase subunit b
LEILDKLGINLGYFLVHFFSFWLMLIILKAWAYDPVVKMLEKRRNTINQGVEDARVAAEARSNAEAEAEKIIGEAHSKASEMMRETTVRAEDTAREIRVAAEKEAEEIRKEALVNAEEERETILGEVRGQIAALSMAATQKLIGESLDAKRQRALIDEFFSGVKAGKVTVVEPAEGDSAVVTSALPLTKKEQDTIKKSVLGSKGTIDFKVDPRILGGLVVQVGDKVLDGSVAGKLESMRQSLK